MNTFSLNKERVTFKEIERAIFKRACKLAVEETVAILEEIDSTLAESRDRRKYRDKGYRQTTIKTVYGEVTYSRHVYMTKDEEGRNASVYLLDKELGMDTIGLISTNLAEKLIGEALKESFRNAAEAITEQTGQSISHSGVWNVVQAMGENIEKEEDRIVREMETERPAGRKETAVLFEEMDGVWLSVQGKDRKDARGLEIKTGTMYEGWEAAGDKRSRLAGKTVMAGVDSSERFHEKWEAKIQSIYDPEKIGMRVLNGDGAGWIHDEYDADAIEQMDRFHVVRMIRQKTSHEEMQREMLRLLREEKTEELLEMSQIYCDSICTKEGDTPQEQNAGELRRYLERHKKELSRYNERGIAIPNAPAGIEYRNMGVQENQNCTVITLRMKGKRRNWSRRGADHMAKLLYCRENKELADMIARNTDGEIMIEPIREKLRRPLRVSETPKVDGKGNNRYIEIMNTHLPILDSANSRSVKVFRRLEGY